MIAENTKIIYIVDKRHVPVHVGPSSTCSSTCKCVYTCNQQATNAHNIAKVACAKIPRIVKYTSIQSIRGVAVISSHVSLH